MLPTGLWMQFKSENDDQMSVTPTSVDSGLTMQSSPELKTMDPESVRYVSENAELLCSARGKPVCQKIMTYITLCVKCC